MKRRALAALPALLIILFASQANAQALECREVELDARYGTAYECKSDWLPDGSRITAEQRTTVNAVVLLTVIAPTTRRRK